MRLIFLFASVWAGPVGPGALLTVGLEDTWWPVASCTQDKACFDWRIANKPGWEGSKGTLLQVSMLLLICH